MRPHSSKLSDVIIVGKLSALKPAPDASQPLNIQGLFLVLALTAGRRFVHYRLAK